MVCLCRASVKHKDLKMETFTVLLCKCSKAESQGLGLRSSCCTAFSVMLSGARHLQKMPGFRSVVSPGCLGACAPMKLCWCITEVPLPCLHCVWVSCTVPCWRPGVLLTQEEDIKILVQQRDSAPATGRERWRMANPSALLSCPISRRIWPYWRKENHLDILLLL